MRGQTAPMRPPTLIEPGLVAGRHPCAFGLEEAEQAVADLVGQGVTLFVDLTEEGELEPYAHLVHAPARRVSTPVRDLSVPPREELVATLDAIDEELGAGGVVYLHCWAGCGRTGVVVGCWLVRHGLEPTAALERIAAARGPGCPQTFEQRLVIHAWRPGD
jgi:protein-tyrosine phosphatase